MTMMENILCFSPRLFLQAGHSYNTFLQWNSKASSCTVWDRVAIIAGEQHRTPIKTFHSRSKMAELRCLPISSFLPHKDVSRIEKYLQRNSFPTFIAVFLFFHLIQISKTFSASNCKSLPPQQLLNKEIVVILIP